jgi:hypothetical protein
MVLQGRLARTERIRYHEGYGFYPICAGGRGCLLIFSCFSAPQGGINGSQ